MLQNNTDDAMRSLSLLSNAGLDGSGEKESYVNDLMLVLKNQLQAIP